MNSYDILNCVYKAEADAERILVALQEGRLDDAHALAIRIFEACGHVIVETGFHPDL